MENSAVSDFISCYTTQWRKPAQVQHHLNDVPALFLIHKLKEFIDVINFVIAKIVILRYVFVYGY